MLKSLRRNVSKEADHLLDWCARCRPPASSPD